MFTFKTESLALSRQDCEAFRDAFHAGGGFALLKCGDVLAACIDGKMARTIKL